jgi:carboxypeptidase Taq
MNTAYQTLHDRFARMSAISGAAAILSWDRATMMPAGGAKTRAQQLATLCVLQHEIITQPDMEELLNSAREATGCLDDWQSANVREMQCQWVHACAMPRDLVEALSQAASKTEMIWRQARADNDFASLAPKLQDLVDLTRQSGQVRGEALGISPYEALIDQFDPGSRVDDIDQLFAELEGFLPELLGQVLEHQATKPAVQVPKGPFPIANQEKLGRFIIERMGFDFEHGRLDVSHHPFSGGTPEDSRITTRYDEADFTSSLMALVHETGHSLYERGLPAQWVDQPVGAARGMTLHESQSLLYEMQAARSDAFIAWLVPHLVEAFNGHGAEWQFENIRGVYRKVEPGFIRVDADEVTYPFHIMLRYGLERQFIAGDLLVKDLPGAWREGMQRYLGLTPPDDVLGCLQDIHWPSGAFGYFPSYTLGALAAAQIFAVASASQPAIADDLAKGEFNRLNGWLGKHIHSQASLYSTPELITRATGAPLGATAFKGHLERRYLSD